MSRAHQRAAQHVTQPLHAPRSQQLPGSASNSAALTEFESAPTLVEASFLGGLDASFGAAASDHRPTFTTETELLDRPGEMAHPKRWEDNKLQIPHRAQRSLSAENIRSDGSFHDFDIGDKADFDSAFEHYGDHGDCALASYATLDNMGYEKPKGDKNSVLKRGDIGKSIDGNLTKVDPEGAKKLLDSIDGGLSDGRPVMLGVDYEGEQHATNTDGVTDHWLVLTNRTYDEDSGEVRYEAIDNASGQASHRVFTVGEDYGLRSAPPPEAGPNSGIGQLPYTATNARIPERKP